MENRPATRRSFLKNSAAAILGISAVSQWSDFAVSISDPRVPIVLRHDLLGDGFMNQWLSRFNRKQSDIRAVSSFVTPSEEFGSDEQTVYILPDLYTRDPNWDVVMARAESIALLADQGKIIPLDDFIANSAAMSRDDFHRSRYNSVLDTASYRGNLWGIPLVADTYALFCNNRLFREAEVVGYPETWDATVLNAKQMTRDINNDGKPDLFGYTQCSFQFLLEFISYGVDLVDMKNHCVHFDSDQGVEALDTYRKCCLYSPEHINFERDDTGMKISVINNTYGRYKHIDYTTIGLPSGTRHANTYGDSDGAIVAAVASGLNTSKTQAAWKTVEWLSGPDNFFQTHQIAHCLPVRRSIRESDKWKQLAAANPRLQTFIDEMDYAVSRPCIPEYRFIKTLLREILYPVQGVGPQASTSAELKAHLKRMTDRANKVLEKSAW